MPPQARRHSVHAGNGAALVVRFRKRTLHLLANSLPSGVARLGMNTSVGHDFNRLVGQQHVNQHAIVVRGVPHAQLREHLNSTFARGLAFEQGQAVQAALHGKANFARVAGFAGLNGGFDGGQPQARKSARSTLLRKKQVFGNA